MDKKTPKKKKAITKTEMMFIWKRHIKPTLKKMTYEEFEKVCEIALKDIDESYLSGEPAIIADYKYSRIIIAAHEYYKLKFMSEREDYNMTEDQLRKVEKYFEDDVVETISESSADVKY